MVFRMGVLQHVSSVWRCITIYFMNYFPFQSLGFRCNPFRALTYEEWAALAVLSEDLQRILDRGFMHLQILGEKGTGKTTHLLALKSLLDMQGWYTAYEYLPEGHSSFLNIPSGLDYFILDEIQRLSPRQLYRLLAFTGVKSSWWRIFNRDNTAGSISDLHLVLGSHKDLTPLFSRHGLALQTLTIRNNTRHLGQVLQKRLSYFSLTPNPSIYLDESAVEWFFKNFNGDYRAVLDCLYDIFQSSIRHGSLRPGSLLNAQQVQEVIERVVEQE